MTAPANANQSILNNKFYNVARCVGLGVATTAATMAGGPLAGALVAAGGEALVQGVEKATGQRKDMDMGSIALSGGSALVFGGGVPVVAKFGSSIVQNVSKGVANRFAQTAASQATNVPTAVKVAGQMAKGAINTTTKAGGKVVNATKEVAKAAQAKAAPVVEKVATKAAPVIEPTKKVVKKAQEINAKHPIKTSAATSAAVGSTKGPTTTPQENLKANMLRKMPVRQK